MSDASTATAKVVVNRAMSLDGFIAGPGHAMDWIAGALAPEVMREQAAATGAMLIGRRTAEVGDRMEAEEPGSVDYPFSGPMFVLTHRPPEPPDPKVTYLTGDIADAVATARSAAGAKNLEILGGDVAGQCLRRGLVDEILVYVLPVLLGDGIRFSPRATPGLIWNRSAARGRTRSRSCGFASAGSRCARRTPAMLGEPSATPAGCLSAGGDLQSSTHSRWVFVEHSRGPPSRIV